MHWMLLQTRSLWKCTSRYTYSCTSTFDTQHGSTYHPITHFNPTHRRPSIQKLNKQNVYLCKTMMMHCTIKSSHSHKKSWIKVFRKEKIIDAEKCSSFHFLSPISFDENAYGNWNALGSSSKSDFRLFTYCVVTTCADVVLSIPKHLMIRGSMCYLSHQQRQLGLSEIDALK